MNEYYVSLDPKEQDRYAREQKKRLVSHRLASNFGEPFASCGGAPWFAANAFLMHHLMSKKGFTVLPFAMSKLPKYLTILGVGFAGFFVGRGLTSAAIIGNIKGEIYNRKRAYLRGEGPLDSDGSA